MHTLVLGNSVLGWATGLTQIMGSALQDIKEGQRLIYELLSEQEKTWKPHILAPTIWSLSKEKLECILPAQLIWRREVLRSGHMEIREQMAGHSRTELVSSIQSGRLSLRVVISRTSGDEV